MYYYISGYAGELHIVHYNAGCANIDEAMKRPDGIAVIAVFLNVLAVNVFEYKFIHIVFSGITR
jgi:hypothetical protein